MITYFYISLGLFVLYLVCKSSYKYGKQEGVQIGFQAGKLYGQKLQQYYTSQTTDKKPKYYSNSTAEWDFKKHRQN